MQILAILAALLIIGFLVNQQMGPQSSQQERSVDKMAREHQIPRVPTTAQDVAEFENEIQSFMQDRAADSATKIETATSQ